MARLRPDGELEPVAPLTRRGVLTAATAGAGFALATLPVTASTIETSADGLVTDKVSYKVGKDETPAYLARPQGNGPFPAVIVVSEVFGLHAHIEDVARRFAHEGYVAIAPDYFYRAGDPSQLTDIADVLKIVSAASLDQILADTDGAFAFLERQSFADINRLGITGFCWGGGTVWMYCAHEPRVKAGVAWYGRLKSRDNSAEDRPWPIDIAASLKVPVLGLYGGLDKGIPVSDVDEMRLALDKAGKSGSEIIVYPNADHAFFADYRPSYKEDDAKDAWTRCLAWFRKNGVGQ